MTMTPGPIIKAAGFYTTAWRQSLSATLDDSGSGSITFQDASHDYIIQQICLQVDNGVGGVAIVEINHNFICGTASGALDSADGEPAIPLRAGEILTISWASVSTGKAAHCTLIGQAVVYR